MKKIIAVIFIGLILSGCSIGQVGNYFSNSNESEEETVVDLIEYNNDEFGFKFRYPAGWELQEISQDNEFVVMAKKGEDSFSVLPKGGFDHGLPFTSNVLELEISGQMAKIIEADGLKIISFYDLDNFRIEMTFKDSIEELERILETFDFIELTYIDPIYEFQFRYPIDMKIESVGNNQVKICRNENGKECIFINIFENPKDLAILDLIDTFNDSSRLWPRQFQYQKKEINGNQAVEFRAIKEGTKTRAVTFIRGNFCVLAAEYQYQIENPVMLSIYRELLQSIEFDGKKMTYQYGKYGYKFEFPASWLLAEDGDEIILTNGDSAGGNIEEKIVIRLASGLAENDLLVQAESFFGRSGTALNGSDLADRHWNAYKIDVNSDDDQIFSGGYILFNKNDGSGLIIKFFTSKDRMTEISRQVFSIAADIVDWNTYRNEEFGLEFRHPTGWINDRHQNSYQFYKTEDGRKLEDEHNQSLTISFYSTDLNIDSIIKEKYGSDADYQIKKINHSQFYCLSSDEIADRIDCFTRSSLRNDLVMSFLMSGLDEDFQEKLLSTISF